MSQRTTKHQLVSRLGCQHLSTQTAMKQCLWFYDISITRYGEKDRQWMFACCDGRPHSLYQRILDEAMICGLCYKPCLNILSYKQHHKENHKECIPSCSREFVWCYMRIGAGNFEMNAVKAFYELGSIPSRKCVN